VPKGAGEPAWLLLVVSSEGQAETLAHQRDSLGLIARDRGWTVTRVVGDDGRGVSSGKLGVRALIQTVLGELRATPAEARPSWLLLTRVDRIGRGANIVETQLPFYELKRLGVRVWTREAGEVRLDTAMEQLFLAMQTAVSSQENAVRRDKLLEKYRQRRAAGTVIGNKAPYGLSITPARTYAAQQPEAKAVRLAFRLRTKGMGYHAIGLELQRVAPPHRFVNGRSMVVRWTPSRVSRLLANRAYLGPVVDEVTFLRAQRVTTQLGGGRGRAPTKHPWPLSGSIRCWCGRAMTGISGGAVGRRIRYYACRALWNHGNHLRLVGADDLEVAFAAHLRELRAKPALIERIRRAAEPSSPALLERAIREARAQLADVTRRRDRIWEAFERDELRGPDAQERLDALTTEREQLQVRVTEIEGQRALAAAARRHDRDAARAISKAEETFADASDADRRLIARSVAVILGGFCVDRDDKLRIGTATDPGRQRRRSAAEG
jgi:DNA invertase Pin-like site-specific DNA recombinase